MNSEMGDDLPPRLAPDGQIPESERVYADKPVATLGSKLDRAARRMAESWMPAFAWLRPFQKVLERVTAFPTPNYSRFARRESLFLTPAFPPRPAFTESAPAAADAPGKPLAPDLRMRLQEIVGPGVQALRVHEGPDADEFARGHGADAVAVGPNVFFQQGRFQPAERAGFGLLVHEATHVVKAMAPGAAWRRATEAGRNEEEREAGARGQAVTAFPHPVSRPVAAAGPFSLPAAPPKRRAELAAQVPSSRAGLPPAAARGPSTGADPSPAQRPMTALAGRAAEPVPAQEPVDLNGLRERLFRDLMSRLKSDFERGA